MQPGARKRPVAAHSGGRRLQRLGGVVQCQPAKVATLHNLRLPRIEDFDSREQQFTWQLADLDDLDTSNAVVRRALRDAHGHWIREAGVDALRIDTAFYVPPDYFEDFLHATDAKAPGMIEVARATGRKDLLVFGEGFGLDPPFQDTQARRIDEYMRGDRRLPAMINFPLQGSLLTCGETRAEALSLEPSSPLRWGERNGGVR